MSVHINIQDTVYPAPTRSLEVQFVRLVGVVDDGIQFDIVHLDGEHQRVIVGGQPYGPVRIGKFAAIGVGVDQFASGTPLTKDQFNTLIATENRPPEPTPEPPDAYLWTAKRAYWEGHAEDKGLSAGFAWLINPADPDPALASVYQNPKQYGDDRFHWSVGSHPAKPVKGAETTMEAARAAVERVLGHVVIIPHPKAGRRSKTKA